MNELGTLLRKLRNDSKKTLEVIHEQTGITDSRLRRIEQGLNESGPSFEILMQLAKCYNANLIDLYLAAGYLDEESLSSYQRVFRNAELLREEEKENIQKQINLFVEGRDRDGI